MKRQGLPTSVGASPDASLKPSQHICTPRRRHVPEEFAVGCYAASRGHVGRVTAVSRMTITVTVHDCWRGKTEEIWDRSMSSLIPSCHVRDGQYCPPKWLQRDPVSSW
ncbi:MAG: hypothetical protein V1907_04485 [Candidatus Kerfeldbacteria bacterium]